MKSKLLLLTITGLLSVFGFAQQDTAVVNKPYYNQDFRISDLVERYNGATNGKQISGYRVQLYSGGRDNANKTRQASIQKFPKVACVLIYEAPDFKVQLGNFRTVMEAEKHLQQIRLEFAGAFVVKSNIDLPQLNLEN